MLNMGTSYMNAPIKRMRDEKTHRAAIEQKALKIANRLNNPTLDVKVTR
jgi:hypothetical protein